MNKIAQFTVFCTAPFAARWQTEQFSFRLKFCALNAVKGMVIKMKKLFPVLSSIVLSVCAVMSVSAQSENINVNYDRDSRIVQISGSFDYLADNDTVHLMLMKPEADLDKAESGEAELKDLVIHIDDINAEGTEFAFDSFKLPENCVMNDYEIRITAKNKEFQSVLYAASKNEILALLQNAEAENIPVFISKYNDVLMLDVDTDSVFSKLNDGNKNRVYSDLAGKNYPSFSDFKSQFNASTVLARLSECNWGEAEKLMSDNNADLKLDLAGFLKLSQTVRDNISMKLCGKTYKTAQELQKAIDAEVSAQTKNTNNGNTGSGGRGGSSTGAPFINPNTSQNTAKDDEPKDDQQGENDVFSDLKGYEWAAESIKKLYSDGVISGREKNIFAPAEYITRAEAAALITRAFTNQLPEKGQSAFGDVKTHWAYQYIDVLYSNGVINGVSEDHFAPDAYITRQDFACIAYRMMEKSTEIQAENVQDTRFADEAEISDYAQKAVYLLREKGIINGMGENEFCPKNNITRAECAVLMDRLIKFSESVE